MAIDNTVGMWNENAGSVYNAREYRRLLERLMGYDVVSTPGTGAGGIFRSPDLAVTQAGSPNMTVLVASGAAYVDGSQSSTQGGYFVYNDASTTVTVPAANVTNPRIDIVGVQVTDSEYSGVTNDAALVLVTGTPAASPVEPTLPANFLTLARVDVAANATSITNANITDRRRRMSALGGVTVCTAATRPAGVTAGHQIFETDTFRALIYNGSAWVTITPVAAAVSTSQSTSSSSYTDLATVGPSVAVQTGAKAMVTLTMQGSNNTTTLPAQMSVAVSGATTLAASDNQQVAVLSYTAGFGWRASATSVISGLTPGSNTFTAKYKAGGGGTASFNARELIVVGIP